MGHGGSPCPAKDNNIPPYKLVVISMTGIHNIKIHWCRCSQSIGKASEHIFQLLRMRWFPASSRRPATVVTFDCLDIFHKITVQGKLTGYDFYQSLVHLTDNTDLDPPRVSFVWFSLYYILTLSSRGVTKSLCELFAFGDT